MMRFIATVLLVSVFLTPCVLAGDECDPLPEDSMCLFPESQDDVKPILAGNCAAASNPDSSISSTLFACLERHSISFDCMQALNNWGCSSACAPCNTGGSNLPALACNSVCQFVEDECPVDDMLADGSCAIFTQGWDVFCGSSVNSNCGDIEADPSVTTEYFCRVNEDDPICEGFGSSASHMIPAWFALVVLVFFIMN